MTAYKHPNGKYVRYLLEDPNLEWPTEKDARTAYDFMYQFDPKSGHMETDLALKRVMEHYWSGEPCAKADLAAVRTYYLPKAE
jgi:hypothetical protein